MHIYWQSISPGLVETTFTTRFYSEKPEIGAAVYGSIQVNINQQICF